MPNHSSDPRAQLTAQVQNLFSDVSVQEIETILWDMFNRTVESPNSTPEEIVEAAFYCRLLTKYLQQMQLLSVLN